MGTHIECRLSASSSYCGRKSSHHPGKDNCGQEGMGTGTGTGRGKDSGKGVGEGAGRGRRCGQAYREGGKTGMPEAWGDSMNWMAEAVVTSQREGPGV